MVALSVDGIANDVNGGVASRNSDEDMLTTLKFPFRAGRAESSTVERLQLLNDTLFELKTPLTIPTSFLIDRKSRVVGIYRGPVSVDQLLADAEKLRVHTTEQWRAATVPFAGQWIMPPRRRHLFDYVNQLASKGHLSEARLYLEQNHNMLTAHPRWPELRELLTARPERPTGKD